MQRFYPSYGRRPVSVNQIRLNEMAWGGGRASYGFTAEAFCISHPPGTSGTDAAAPHDPNRPGQTSILYQDLSLPDQLPLANRQASTLPEPSPTTTWRVRNHLPAQQQEGT
jgi:hypothetical protein